MAKTIRVLFLAAEAEPFVKVGGLADVAGSLPVALRELPGHATHDFKLDVRLVIPLHKAIQSRETTLYSISEFPVFRRGVGLQAQLYNNFLAGMPVYFINGGPISSATTVYAADPGLDRDKYSFFSLAILEMLHHLDWWPDILHANDWHTALALYALRSRRDDPAIARVRTLLTLHNLPYMGGDGTDVLAAYGLPPLSDERLPDWACTQPLPLGLWAADAIVPVSPTYAREILTPEFGCGLEQYLRCRADKITGILNGLDLKSWDPSQDGFLAEKFSPDDLAGRGNNKVALQKKLDLPIASKVPVLAMVGRVDPQKGVDLTLSALSQLAESPWQFVLLGTGDPALEKAVLGMQADYPDRIRVFTRYDAALSRLIYAGADMFLMPSRYEPCGLAQMIAMRYGCVPVVHATGGLKDTVQEGKTGFLFDAPTAEAMADVLHRALLVYASPAKWRRLQRNGMKTDFSWLRSASQYATIYRSLVIPDDR